jgi:hypothetical protein
MSKNIIFVLMYHRHKLLDLNTFVLVLIVRFYITHLKVEENGETSQSNCWNDVYLD